MLPGKWCHDLILFVGPRGIPGHVRGHGAVGFRRQNSRALRPKLVSSFLPPDSHPYPGVVFRTERTIHPPPFFFFFFQNAPLDHNHTIISMIPALIDDKKFSMFYKLRRIYDTIIGVRKKKKKKKRPLYFRMKDKQTIQICWHME